MPNCFIIPKGADPKHRGNSRIKLRLAKQLVDKGKAIWITKGLLVQRTVEIPKGTCGIRSKQGRAYERAATETVIRPHLIGGLTRTETQPKNLSPFAGARVGHQ